MAHSRSSLALHQLLDEQCPQTEALRRKFHRTVLHRLRMGKNKPNVTHASVIEELTDGRVPANGWRDIEAAAKRKRSRAA